MKFKFIYWQRTLALKGIIKAINFASNFTNKRKINNVENPYGKGGASKKIVNILKHKNFKNLILKKFYNVKFK